MKPKPYSDRSDTKGKRCSNHDNTSARAYTHLQYSAFEVIIDSWGNVNVDECVDYFANNVIYNTPPGGRWR